MLPDILLPLTANWRDAPRSPRVPVAATDIRQASRSLFVGARLNKRAYGFGYLDRAARAKPATVASVLKRRFNRKRLRKLFLRFCCIGSLEILGRLRSIKRVNPVKAFLLACKNGHLECARWLFAQYPDIEKNRPVKHNALCCACAGGHLELARWLDEKFLFVEAIVRAYERNRALRMACINGHTEVASWLRERFRLDVADARALDNEALFAAAAHGDTEVLLMLFDTFGVPIEDAKQNDNQALRSACTHGRLPAAMLLLAKCRLDASDVIESNSVEAACEYGHFDVVIWLYGILERTRKASPLPLPRQLKAHKISEGLRIAVRRGSVDMVDFLSKRVHPDQDFDCHWHWATLHTPKEHREKIGAILCSRINFNYNHRYTRPAFFP